MHKIFPEKNEKLCVLTQNFSFFIFQIFWTKISWIYKISLLHNILVEVRFGSIRIIMANDISGFEDILGQEYFSLGPNQVKYRHLICSIFYAMNFWHFLEMLEFNFCRVIFDGPFQHMCLTLHALLSSLDTSISKITVSNKLK